MFDRHTLQEMYRTSGACAQRQFDTFADFEGLDGTQGSEIYNIVDRTSYMCRMYIDFNHVIGDLVCTNNSAEGGIIFKADLI